MRAWRPAQNLHAQAAMMDLEPEEGPSPAPALAPIMAEPGIQRLPCQSLPRVPSRPSSPPGRILNLLTRGVPLVWHSCAAHARQEIQ